MAHNLLRGSMKTHVGTLGLCWLRKRCEIGAEAICGPGNTGTGVRAEANRYGTLTVLLL